MNTVTVKNQVWEKGKSYFAQVTSYFDASIYPQETGFDEMPEPFNVGDYVEFTITELIENLATVEWAIGGYSQDVDLSFLQQI